MGRKGQKHNSSSSQRDRIFIFALLILLSIALRIYLSPFVSDDMRDFFLRWLDYVEQHNGFSALQDPFTNYTPIYSYYLVLIYRLTAILPKTLLLKLLSISFDYISAFFVYRLTALKYPKTSAPGIATLVFLYCPTVVLNSSVWGQIDGVYTAALLASLYWMLQNRMRLSLSSYGFALATKLQAVFFGPLIFILLLKRKIPWTALTWAPRIYLLSLIPAWIAGRSFTDLSTIYFQQFHYYQYLTLNCPNIYQWISNEHFETFKVDGIAFSGILISIYCYYALRSRAKLEAPHLITIALTSCVILPYFLPKMHDRYFYPADVLSILYCFYFPDQIAVAILIQLASLFVYINYLWHLLPIPLPALSLLPLGALVLLAIQNYKMFYKSKTS
jgi:Gpi18-like mannosyltransferase